MTRGLDLVEEERHLLAGLDLDLLPESNLRRGGAGLVLLQGLRNGLQPGGQRRQALGQRGVIPGKHAEQPVSHSIHGRGPPLPDAMNLRVEELAANVVEGQLAL